MPTETPRASAMRRAQLWIREHSFYPSIVILVLLFFLVLLSNRIVFNIGPGERGVRWSRFAGGTVIDRAYAEGVRLIFPWDRMYIYNIRVQEINDEIVLLSSNGLPITISYSCRYYPNPGTVPTLHQRYGENYAEVLVRPEVVSALRVVIGNYRPEDIYARDEQGLLDEIHTVLEANLTTDYVVVRDILIKSLRLTPSLEEAIDDKLAQEQHALAYEFRLQLEEAERQRKMIEAEGIQAFEAISGISMLSWRGIQATERFADSPNTKVVIVGTGQDQLPIILGNQ